MKRPSIIWNLLAFAIFVYIGAAVFRPEVAFAHEFTENSPVFAADDSKVSVKIQSERVRVALKRVDQLIKAGFFRLYFEPIIQDGSYQIKKITQEISSVAISYRNLNDSSVTVESNQLFITGDLIIYSFPGDTDHMNRVFQFEGERLIQERPLAEFLISNLTEDHVALSRAVYPAEALVWQDPTPEKLAAAGDVYKGYGGRVLHFQLGLENAYRSPGKSFVALAAPKTRLLSLLKQGLVWSSVNQVGRGVHGLLFEIVLRSEAASEAGFKIHSVTQD